jgi:methionyl-tRNA synthetase
MTYYVTTAIPFVNAAPHLGHALELVQADVLARHRRLRGQQVRLVTGTDDNALKNVTAAQAAGVDVRTFVDANAERFADLRGALGVPTDDFIRTSSQRHRTGVERLWRQCAAQGDFYRHTYEGRYCTGCEEFVSDADLVDGRCPEHRVPPETVTETNWYFRLSKYQEPVLDAIESDRVHIEPPARRNEVLGFVRGGLRDFSVSRPVERSAGWGIPVPDDPDQVVYVWWDALANYITALGYGTEHADYDRWWRDSDERVHVIGKGIVRFHAVHWIALLLATGAPLPTQIAVHDYLTVDSAKISKSAGTPVHPADLVERFGVDAVRWWLLRDVATLGETDFTVDRLVRRADSDLAGGLGNLVNRVVTLVWSSRNGRVPPVPPAVRHGRELVALTREVPGHVDAALRRHDFRTALGAIWQLVDGGNVLVEQTRPWALARAERDGDAAAAGALDEVLAVVIAACRTAAVELSPFIPSGATRLLAQLGSDDTVAPASPVFPRRGSAEAPARVSRDARFPRFAARTPVR